MNNDDYKRQLLQYQRKQAKQKEEIAQKEHAKALEKLNEDLQRHMNDVIKDHMRNVDAEGERFQKNIDTIYEHLNETIDYLDRKRKRDEKEEEQQQYQEDFSDVVAGDSWYDEDEEDYSNSDSVGGFSAVDLADFCDFITKTTAPFHEDHSFYVRKFKPIVCGIIGNMGRAPNTTAKNNLDTIKDALWPARKPLLKWSTCREYSDCDFCGCKKTCRYKLEIIDESNKEVLAGPFYSGSTCKPLAQALVNFFQYLYSCKKGDKEEYEKLQGYIADAMKGNEKRFK